MAEGKGRKRDQFRQNARGRARHEQIDRLANFLTMRSAQPVSFGGVRAFSAQVHVSGVARQQSADDEESAF